MTVIIRERPFLNVTGAFETVFGKKIKTAIINGGLYVNLSGKIN
jgi:hypothetical protein